MSVMTSMLYDMQLLNQLHASQRMSASMLDSVEADANLSEITRLDNLIKLSDSEETKELLRSRKEELIKALI